VVVWKQGKGKGVISKGSARSGAKKTKHKIPVQSKEPKDSVECSIIRNYKVRTQQTKSNSERFRSKEDPNLAI
jgi:hypothetical protein